MAHEILSAETNILIIICCCFVGLVYAVINAIYLSKIRLTQSSSSYETYNKMVDEEVWILFYKFPLRTSEYISISNSGPPLDPQEPPNTPILNIYRDKKILLLT